MAKVTFKSQLPAHVVSGWQSKVMGPLPSEAQLQVAHAFSQRFGLEAFAGLACALRDGGVTAKVQRQISALWSQGKSTGTHKNKVQALVDGGYFTYSGDGRHAVTITPAGQKRLDAYVTGRIEAKAADKPAKAAPKAKVSKPRKPASKPAVQLPAPGNDGQGTVEQQTA